MRDNFEEAVSFLLPVDPYSKSRAHGSRHNPQVSDTTLQNKQQSKTGVDFRWHKPDEYSKLSKDQRIELYEWQSSKEGKAKTAKQRKESNVPNSTRSAKKKLQAKVSALEAQLKEAQQPEMKDIQAFIASVQQAKLPPVPPTTPPVKPSIASATIALQQLLKRKREE